MKTKTSDLTGAALDWAVDEARGFGADYLKWWRVGGDTRFTHCEIMRAYSTDWAQGGPIIEREKIKLFPNIGRTWSSQIRHETDHPLVAHRVLAGWTNKHGPTPLIAAMRCYVASKLGDTIDIPEELL